MVAADLGAIALRQTQQVERRKQREQPDHYADDTELSVSSDRSGFRRFLLQTVVIASVLRGGFKFAGEAACNQEDTGGLEQ